MKIVIIPGFIDSPEGKCFPDLERLFNDNGHTVINIAWPHFPSELDKYSITSTLEYAREILKNINCEDLVILGFSMGGIIATILANEFKPKKLGLIVSPYQAGTDDDLEGKYKEWKEMGYRVLTTKKFGELNIPFSFIEDARKYNALDVIGQITCPKLFIVAENDDKVSREASTKLYEKAREIKEWKLIQGMEHKYQYQPEMLKRVNEILMAFVDLEANL